MAVDRMIKAATFGGSGQGKTSLLWTLLASTTLFWDLEAGDLAVDGWTGDTVRPRTWDECRDLAAFIGGPNAALRDEQAYSQANFDKVCAAYSNSVEAVRTIRADRKIEGADPGIARATCQITARFADTTLLTQAQNGTAGEFAFAFAIDANRSLTSTLHKVYLALAKTPIKGPAGVEASFEFRAAFNATATRMMTAALKNQQAGTDYA